MKPCFKENIGNYISRINKVKLICKHIDLTSMANSLVTTDNNKYAVKKGFVNILCKTTKMSKIKLIG